MKDFVLGRGLQTERGCPLAVMDGASRVDAMQLIWM